jgi:hypothetical protein
MKYISLVAGILLGLCFLMASVPVLFNIPMPAPKIELSPAAQHFM